MKKTKVIQIAIQSGFDGVYNSGKPVVYVLYDNGEVWRALASETHDEWVLVDTPDFEASLDHE